MNGLGQGPVSTDMNEATAREASLNAVHDDLLTLRELIANLDTTIHKLQDHLMGAQPILQEAIEKKAQERPPTSGMIPAMCEIGAMTIQDVHRLQERVNQICYELGEGRDR